jgi:3-isopropylmalate dehydrogenase
MKKSIVLLPGDGIGPETAAGVNVLKSARELSHFQFAEHPIGGTVDVTGTPLPMTRWKLAATPTLCSWALLAVQSGMPCRWASVRAACLAYARHGPAVNARPVKLLEPPRHVSAEAGPWRWIWKLFANLPAACTGEQQLD